MQPATMKFCEENLNSWISQPANAFSNIVYVLVGLFLLIYYRKNKNNVMQILPIMAILVGITSFLYHASFSFFFQVFDLASMFLLSSFLVVFNLKRLGVVKNFFVSFYLVLLVQIVLLLIIREKSGEFIFGILVVFSIILEIILAFRSKNIIYRDYLFAILTFAVAWSIWLLDINRIVCDPANHIINGHALWHIINSFSILFLYRFYRQFKV